MKLSIMSWNIHRAIGMDRRFKIDRIAKVVRHHDPDILLLQEVDRGVPRSRKLWLDHEIAKMCDYPAHSWAQAHTLKIGSYGNATLSRFPIEKRKHLDLTVAWKKTRNALYTRLKMPGRFKPLHIFNWHLGLSAIERKAQVKRLFRSGAYRKLSTRDRIILGGDTNDWRNLLYPYADIKLEHFHAWSEHQKRRHLYTFPAPKPIGALDKIFWRGAFANEHLHVSKLALARVASDHRPILAEFDLS